MTMPSSASQAPSLPRLVFGEPIVGMPEPQPPYTPPQPRRTYQQGLMRLEGYRRARMEAAAAAEDWEAYDRWRDAPVLPALLIGEPGQNPETVPSLLTALFWDDDSVTARVVTATPEGDLLPEDVTLLRRHAGQYVVYVPVIHDR